MPDPLLTTQLGSLPLVARGKVRDIYALNSNPDSDLLFVATDRISAFDHVLGSGIPDKGRILTQLSLFWFDLLKDIVPNHLVTAAIADYPAPLRAFATQLEGRSMIVKRARMFPVECVLRAYLSGTGWKDYQATSLAGSPAICDIPLPSGLRESDRLPQPIFTPAAKINTGGHDENIPYGTMVRTIGAESSERLRALTFTLFERASKHAEASGILLADTKFEFGLIPSQRDGEMVALCDEVLTPDSSRYWPAATHRPGGPQPSFDKQFVRDYLESIHWNKREPAPALPQEIVEKTRAKYLEAFQLITGRSSL